MFKLIHLPTAQEVSHDQFRETMEFYLDHFYFYLDPTDSEIKSLVTELEGEDIEYCLFDSEQREIIKSYSLIKLDKCEFEIVSC